MKLLNEKDFDLNKLEGKKVAVIGYGAQGRAQAIMMSKSGVNVVVGVRENGLSYKKAQEDGIEVKNISDATSQADVIHILLPDEVQKDIYENEILPNLSSEKTLSFSHGFNVIFDRIKPSKDINIIMVAPKAPGTEELKVYNEGFGVPALISVYNNATGDAKDIAMSMAHAMNFTKAGVLECSFRDETNEDLFGEQAVLCGGAAELVKAGFETLTEAGYPPEMAYFECLHELKLIVDLMYEGGIEHMYDVVSNTAEYGGRTVGPKIIDARVRESMKEALKKVESGEFAKEWMDEYKNGLPNLKKMRDEGKKEKIEIEGDKIRKLFKR